MTAPEAGGRSRPGDTGHYLRLLMAVLAVSTAAPLVRLAASGPTVVAFWRVCLAAAGVLLVAAVAASARPRPVRVGTGSLWALAAGVLLGLHFWVWITSLYYTSVANSVLLVTTQPVWAAIIGRIFLRERVPLLGWLGILLALAGSAATIGYEGLRLRGDLLALAGAILAASYMVVGRRQRRSWETLPYIAHVYTASALTLLAVMAIRGVPFLPADTRDWWLFAALAAIPTGLGHTLYNVILKHLPAYVVATSITAEPIGASLLAVWWLGEVPPVKTLLLAPLILAGILLVGFSRRRKEAAIG